MMDLPVASDTAATTTDTPPDIHGLAERAGPRNLTGWALDGSRPGHRLQLELYLGEQLISSGIADRPRPDLEANGIGDGRHAFELPVAPELLPRVAEFRLFGLAADGSKRRVPLRVRRPAEAPAAAAPAPAPVVASAELERLKADVAALAQRLARLPEAKALHDALTQQAALAGQVGATAIALDRRLAGLPGAEAFAAVITSQEALASGQQGVADRLATLETWLARLERRLDDMPAAQSGSAPAAPGLDIWQKVLFGALVGALVGALGISLILRAL